MFRSAVLLLFSTFLAVQPLAAAPEPSPTIKASIFCFRYAPELDTIYLRDKAGGYIKTELSTANIVGPQDVVVENQFVTLHRQQAGANGETTYPMVGRVRVPDACPRALILLLPAAKGAELPYHSLAFAHTDQGFPLGSMKMVNLSPYPVRGAVGADTVNVASGKVVDFKPTGAPGASVDVLFQFQKEDRWQRMAATRWTLREDRRFLMCIYEDPASGRMHLRSIPDRTKP